MLILITVATIYNFIQMRLKGKLSGQINSMRRQTKDGNYVW